MKTLLLLFLICAPQLKDKPIEWYEKQIVVGIKMYGHDWDQIEVVDIIGDGLVKFNVEVFGPEYPSIIWHSNKRTVALWLKDDPRNKK